jgi:hypothetical protein
MFEMNIMMLGYISATASPAPASLNSLYFIAYNVGIKGIMPIYNQTMMTPPGALPSLD